MSIHVSRKSVSGAAVLLTDGDADFSNATLYNNGTAVAYLGHGTVTAATGFPLPAGTGLSFDLPGGERPYAICAGANTTEIAVLEVSVDR